MTSLTGKQIIAIHILPNIPRSKGNHTKKFGQLLECDMRNISLNNHKQNVVEKLVSNTFLKTQKLSISLGLNFFFKPGQPVRLKQYYVGQGKFQIGHQTKLFLKEIRTSRVCVALKII